MAKAFTLFVYSRLTIADGHTFDGYIAYSIATEHVYSVEFWDDQESFGFNEKLVDFAADAVARLEKHFGIAPLKVFPIRYSILAEELSIPDGEFDLDRNWTPG